MSSHDELREAAMIDVGQLARRITGAVARSRGGRSAPRLSEADVLGYLGPRSRVDEAELAARDPRLAPALDRALAQLPRLVIEERLPQKHKGFARYFESLPRILFLYGRGHGVDEIASEMRFIATGFGVESVLRIVARTVARRASAA